MINTLLLPELREMLATDDVAGLREFGAAIHPARAAEFMEGLDQEESLRVLLANDPATCIEIFGYLEEPKKIQIVESAEPATIAPIVAELPADDRVDLFKAISPDSAEQILPLLPLAERRELLRLRQYPEGTAGSVMTTEVGRLQAQLTVREALDAISRQAEELETVYYHYITDEQDRLLGLVSARQLVTHFNKPDTKLIDIMQRDVVAVQVTDDQETVAKKVGDYDFLAIPVVDEQRRLVGIITHDDILDVIREEATEDAHRSAAVNPLSEGYLETHWYTLAWKRGIWLTILFFGAMLTILALHNYEQHLEKLAWLVFFLPLVTSSGGNSGSQSATLVITALTNGEVTVADWARIAFRELLMGLCLGGALGAGGFVCALFVTGSVAQAMVIPATLLMVVTAGTLLGGVLPLVFRRLGLDPALMSNPFVAGIIDVTGIVIYMNVAWLMLRELRVG